MTSAPPRSIHRLIGVLALVLLGLVARAGAAAPRPLWSVHAGAPLSGPPGIGPDGGLVLGTSDGYVHAFRADGVFRYSYTLDGRVLASPVVLADGLVLAASGAGKLYAIKPDGSLLWETTVAGGVVSPLAVDAESRVWMRTGSGTTIAYSRRGGVVGFAKTGRATSVGPTPLTGLGVLVGDPEGGFTLIGDFGKNRRFRASPPSSVVAIEGGFALLSGGSLLAYGRELSTTFNLAGVEAVVCAKPLVARRKNELVWLAPNGSVEAHVPVGAFEGPSTCRASSVFAVEGSGRILELRPSGEVTPIDAASGEVSALEAARPGALVVAYRDGRVVALKVAP